MVSVHDELEDIEDELTKDRVRASRRHFATIQSSDLSSS